MVVVRLIGHIVDNLNVQLLQLQLFLWGLMEAEIVSKQTYWFMFVLYIETIQILYELC